MQEEDKGFETVKTTKRRWPKIVGISFGGVIGILAIIVSLIPTIVSSDMVKNKIISNLETSLNRKVQIDDVNMSWSSGLDIKNIHIKEREGLPGDTFVKVNRILCDIEIFPLLKKQIRINDLIIDSPEIVLQRDKEGVFNYEDIGKPMEPIPVPEKDERPIPEIVEKPVKKPKYEPMVIPAFLFDIRIRAKINDGEFAFIDHQLQEETIIKDLETTLNIEALDKPIELKSDFDIKSRGETEHAEISLNLSLAKDGEINPLNANGLFNMETSFTQVVADFDMARFRGEGGTGLNFLLDVDLKKLTEKLAGILSLPKGLQIEGLINSKMVAEGQLDKMIGVEGNTEITNLSISGGPLGDKPIREPRIRLLQNADIDMVNNKATVHKVSFESNFAEMFLAGLITDFKNTRDLDFKIFLNLDITKLMNEIGSLLPEDIEVAGKLESNIKLQGNQNKLGIDGKTDLRGLFARMGAIGPITEPEIQIVHNTIFNLQDSSLEIKKLGIDTSFANIKSSGTLNKNKEIELNLLLESDIEKLTHNLQSIVSLPQGLNVNGKIAADINTSGPVEKELKLSGKTILLGINATGGPLKDTRISNFDLKLIHTLDYKITEDSVNIEQMDIASDFLNMESKGGIANLSKEKNIDYELSLNMDLDKMTTLFSEMFPANVNMSGKSLVDVGINGNLAAKDIKDLCENMNLNGNISVDKIKYDAYEITDIQSKLQLSDGLFTTKDFVFNMNEGSGSMLTRANLKEEKPAIDFSLDLSDMHINQKMDVLAYIIPILSAPDGQISGKLNMMFKAKGYGLNWQDDLSKSLNGQGGVDIKEGHIRGGKITSKILKTFGMKREYEFENISSQFRVNNSKVFADEINVNGKDFDIGLSGWTSFYGHLEYATDAEVLGRNLGGDAGRILRSMGEGSKLPIIVTGTINRPRLAFKWPEPREIGSIIEGILGDSKGSRQKTETAKEPTSEEIKEKETAELPKETKPEKKKIKDTVEKLFKSLFK